MSAEISCNMDHGCGGVKPILCMYIACAWLLTRRPNFMHIRSSVVAKTLIVVYHWIISCISSWISWHHNSNQLYKRALLLCAFRFVLHLCTIITSMYVYISYIYTHVTLKHVGIANYTL